MLPPPLFFGSRQGASGPLAARGRQIEYMRDEINQSKCNILDLSDLGDNLRHCLKI